MVRITQKGTLAMAGVAVLLAVTAPVSIHPTLGSADDAGPVVRLNLACAQDDDKIYCEYSPYDECGSDPMRPEPLLDYRDKV